MDLDKLTQIELNRNSETLEKQLKVILNKDFPKDITNLEIELSFSDLHLEDSIVLRMVDEYGVSDSLPITLVDKLFSSELAELYYYHEDVSIEDTLTEKVAMWIYEIWKNMNIKSSFKISVGKREASRYFLLNKGKWVDEDELY